MTDPAVARNPQGPLYGFPAVTLSSHGRKVDTRVQAEKFAVSAQPCPVAAVRPQLTMPA